MSKPTIRIVVAEPFGWKYGNLVGEILAEINGDKLKVKLTQTIQGKLFSSDILLLTPRIKNETFKKLRQYYSVTVNGALINVENNELDFILIGDVTYD